MNALKTALSLIPLTLSLAACDPMTHLESQVPRRGPQTERQGPQQNLPAPQAPNRLRAASVDGAERKAPLQTRPWPGAINGLRQAATPGDCGPGTVCWVPGEDR